MESAGAAAGRAAAEADPALLAVCKLGADFCPFRKNFFFLGVAAGAGAAAAAAARFENTEPPPANGLTAPPAKLGVAEAGCLPAACCCFLAANGETNATVAGPSPSELLPSLPLPLPFPLALAPFLPLLPPLPLPFFMLLDRGNFGLDVLMAAGGEEPRSSSSSLLLKPPSANKLAAPPAPKSPGAFRCMLLLLLRKGGWVDEKRSGTVCLSDSRVKSLEFLVLRGQHEDNNSVDPTHTRSSST